MAKRKAKLPDRYWMVVAPLTKILVQAPDRETALEKTLALQPHTKGKRWLAVGWDVHEATEEELREYAALAEAHRKSQPTAKTIKRKTVYERLEIPGQGSML